MSLIRSLVIVCAMASFIVVHAQAPQAPVPPGEDAAPQLTEKDKMTLTILQQQIEIAGQRLQLVLVGLKKAGWHVDNVGGQWVYVPDTPEKK